MSAENHPAKAHIEAHRISTSPSQPMVGAAGRHAKIITLVISQDHGAEGHSQVVTKVSMTLAQWAALTSQTNTSLDRGVPATLERIGNQRIETYPGETSELEKTTAELRAHYDQATEKAAAAVTELREAIETKKGIREVRRLVNTAERALKNMPDNGAHIASTVEKLAQQISIEMDFAQAQDQAQA